MYNSRCSGINLRCNLTVTFFRRALVTLAVLILTAATAWADGAKTLPYSYGFENNDLAAEGWTTVDNIYKSGINYNKSNETFEFIFTFDGIKIRPQYLISPEIDSEGKDYKLSFSFTILKDDNFIQVGYSTTTNNLDAFTTWDAEISGVHYDTLYEKDVPADTKYIAIKCNMHNNPNIQIDNFTFVVNGCLPPENLELSDITDQSAMLTWTAPATSKIVTGYAYQYKKVSENTWSVKETTSGTSAVTNGLIANTNYDFRVQTLYEGGLESDFTYITILTDCSALSLPISQGFNYYSDEGLGCWRIINGYYNTRIYSNNTFGFVGEAHQYLISPQISSSSALSVSFNYKVSDAYPKTFQVGYSSTTDATTAFVWEPAITVDEASEWTTYKHTFPAGSKYIAIEYLSDKDQNILIIDDINIFVDGVEAPNQLSASNISCDNVTLTWTATSASVTSYAYQYKKTSESTWSDEATTTDTYVTINSLTADADYNFRVRTVYGNDYSVYATNQFTTATALPYEQDFEDGMGRWSMVDSNVYPYYDQYNEYGVDYALYTGRKTKAACNGAVGFQYYKYTSDPISPQYLISPRFSGTEPIEVSFYYRVPTNISETIQVGYSTTTNDIGSFTFGSAITVNSSNWTKYENNFPTGVKYIAIKYTSNNYELYLDDFYFSEYAPYAKPTTIEVDKAVSTDTQVRIVWSIPNESATACVYQYKEMTSDTWTAEATTYYDDVTLTNLKPNTNYDFRVKLMYGSNASNFLTFHFLTDASVVSLPYFDGFENGMGGWRLKECDGATTIIPNNPHSGSYSFWFINSDEHQYLISPHFAGGTPIKVSFYYTNYENYAGFFQVGYASSKTTNITWGEIVATSHGEWNIYEMIAPAETQYIIICCRGEGNMLYLDDFSFLPMTSVTFAKEGYSTYYNGQADAVLPAGMKARIITAKGGGQTLTYETVADGDLTAAATATVPAGTAVMLQVAPAGATQSIDVALTSPAAAAISQANLLHGSDAETTTTGGDLYYKLSYNTGGTDLGWYWGAQGGAEFTSAAHKAWLALPSSGQQAPARSIGLPGFNETTTDVTLITYPAEDDAWYDLLGRKLNAPPTTEGLYIRGGHKIMIK